MTATHANQIIDGYLKRLDVELADLPPARRKEVAGQIAEHIAEARSELSEETDADLLTILDKLGEPDDIAAEARASFDVSPVRPGPIEIIALLLLGVGGIVLPVPPLMWIVGAVFVWRSKVWTSHMKMAGVYVPLVVGLGLLVLSGLTAGLFSDHLILAPFALAMLACVLLPLGSAIYLGVRLGRRLPVVAWVAIALVAVAVYVPPIAIVIPARQSAFIGTEAGPPGPVPKPDVPGCGGFYGTQSYASGTPMAASVPVSVGICWDLHSVRKTWGPDCFPSYGPGLVVSVQSCTATAEPDGSLIVSVQSTVRPLLSFTGLQSAGWSWRITPDGRISQA